MPSSHIYQLNEITDLLLRCNPMSLLDVGVGFGKYGFLAREYLELWDGRFEYGKWRRRIDGIEIFPEFIGDLQRAIYDEIHIGDALEIIPRLPLRYDLILLVDVLEHFHEPEARALLGLSLERGRNVLVSTPLDIGRQGAKFGNEHETHHFQWRPQDLAGDVAHFFVPNPRSIIWFAGEDARRVEALGAVGVPIPKPARKAPAATTGSASVAPTGSASVPTGSASAVPTAAPGQRRPQGSNPEPTADPPQRVADSPRRSQGALDVRKPGPRERRSIPAWRRALRRLPVIPSIYRRLRYRADAPRGPGERGHKLAEAQDEERFTRLLHGEGE